MKQKPSNICHFENGHTFWQKVENTEKISLINFQRWVDEKLTNLFCLCLRTIHLTSTTCTVFTQSQTYKQTIHFLVTWFLDHKSYGLNYRTWFCSRKHRKAYTRNIQTREWVKILPVTPQNQFCFVCHLYCLSLLSSAQNSIWTDNADDKQSKTKKQ